MAKTHVANVAGVSFVGRDEAAKARARLPEYVASAGGELGLLSKRPSDGTPVAERSKAKARRRVKQTARSDRKIGAGLKGDLLRAIYVRLAQWLVSTGKPSVVVAANDEEISELLPYLVGPGPAKRVAKSAKERRRTISQMAFDWRTVIGDGVTMQAEDSPVTVTFHLSGAGGERRFWLTAELTTESGVTPIVPPPVLGATPPVDLTVVVEQTKVYRAPYMQWAEQLRGAAMHGDPVAVAALTMLRTGVVVAKTTAGLLAAILFAALLLFALPAHDLQARVIDTVTRWVHLYIIKNETPDNSLPSRLRVEGQPIYEDQNFLIQKLDARTLVVTLRNPTEMAQQYRMTHRHGNTPVNVEHIEWEWRIHPKHLPAPIYKRTENPQLRIVMDRSDFDISEMRIGCGPIHVHHEVSDPFGVGVPSLPPTGPPTPADLDQRDLLVIADPKTHDGPPAGGDVQPIR